MALHSSELRRFRYFSGLSEASLAGLLRKLKVMEIPAGTELITEGAVGDAFYLIGHGRFEVTKMTRSGQEAKISVLGGGQGFGETALLACTARTCSVRALSDAVVYRLSHPDFEEVVLHEAAFKDLLLQQAHDHDRFNRIKTLQPFANLEPEKMHILLSRMSVQTFRPGEDIITQGDRGDCYYIVKTGRVAVLKKSREGTKEERVAVLSPGDGFGEEALIRDDPRNATCRAMEETTVYALGKNDFTQILKASYLENIFSEEIPLETYRDRYVFIDARVPAEYADEHIEGALNIPVERLRGIFGELDPTREYITYCTNDARGMVAAYLLKNHGFNAKCLRGGISGWTGPTAAG